MECKYAPSNENFEPNGELIDTLWNVNGLTKLKHNMALAMELIDTLWNVND